MPMGEVTQILTRMDRGELSSASELLPLVYAELRKLAAVRLAKEAGPITLQPTALVHEAYLRLVSSEADQFQNKWEGRRHFFAAASESMRRILVESARKRQSLQRGGNLARHELHESRLMAPQSRDDDELLAVSEALDQLAATDSEAAEIVKLRYFTGLSIEEVADVLDMSPRTIKRRWAYARVWLMDVLKREDQ